MFITVGCFIQEDAFVRMSRQGSSSDTVESRDLIFGDLAQQHGKAAWVVSYRVCTRGAVLRVDITLSNHIFSCHLKSRFTFPSAIRVSRDDDNSKSDSKCTD